MKESTYLIIDSSILPAVYGKVLEAKNLLLTGSASSVSQAVRMAGISRSAYYKYKDKIAEYKSAVQGTATVGAKLLDNAGVLSAMLGEIYRAGANVLSIHQSSPVNDIADVSVTVSLGDSTLGVEELIHRIKEVSGVQSAEII